MLSESDLVAMENRFWKSMQDGDAGTAMALTDQECIVTGGQGVGKITREQMGGMLTSASWKLLDYTFKDVTTILSEAVAMIAYTVSEKLMLDGKPLTLEAADASTWVKHGGTWVCAMHTESVLGDPFGRDRGR